MHPSAGRSGARREGAGPSPSLFPCLPDYVWHIIWEFTADLYKNEHNQRFVDVLEVIVLIGEVRDDGICEVAFARYIEGVTLWTNRLINCKGMQINSL